MKQLILFAVMLAALTTSNAQTLKPSNLVVAKPYEFTAQFITNRGDTLIAKSHSWKMIEGRVCMTTLYEGGITHDIFVNPSQLVCLTDKRNTVIPLQKK